MPLGPVTVTLLGGPSVRTAEGVAGERDLGGRRAAIALGRLVLTTEQVVSAAELAAAIWPDEPPDAWQAALRTVVARLRSVLTSLGDDGSAIATLRGGYQLALPAGSSNDVAELHAGVDSAEALLATGDALGARTRAEGLIALGSATFLAGQPDEGWVAAQRSRVQFSLYRLLCLGAKASLVLGEPARAESLAGEAASSMPLREEAQLLLMRALAARGERAAALDVYHRHRERLDREQAVTPGSEVEQLFAQIVGGPDHVILPGSPLALLHSSFPLVGRQAALALIEQARRESERSGARRITVEGEPGIGKTRFAAEVAAVARRDGAAVLYGRADDQGGSLNGPVVQALDTFLAQLPGARRRSLAGRHGAVLARFIPAVRDVVEPGTPTGIPDLDRQHFADAAFHVLGGLADEQPVLLILDDLQWSGEATAKLVDGLLERLAGSALLVLELQRPQGNQAEPPVITLPPLDADEVTQLARDRLGERPDLDRLGPAVWADSGGNALLAGEILRFGIDRAVALAEGQQPAPSERLRTIVRRRVGTLSRAAQEFLDVAAVAGLDVDTAVVAAASGVTGDGALLEVEREGLLGPSPAGNARRTFRHALIRASLLDDLGSDRREELHRRLTEALEQGGGVATTLAYHSAGAAPLGDWARALRYGRRAAELAAAASVHDDVVTVATRTLDVLAAAGDPDPIGRLDLTVLLGAAQRADDETTGRATLRAVVDEARERGAAVLFARAALAFSEEGASADEMVTDDGLTELYEEALAGLGTAEDRLRARLLGRLATAYGWRRDATTAQRYSAQAQALARASGDPVTLATVLTSSRRLLTQAAVPLVAQALEDELLTLADELDDPLLRARAWLWRFQTDLELGRGDELELALERAGIVGDDGRLPVSYRYTLAYCTAALHLVRGELEAADEAVETAYRIGNSAGLDPLVTDGIRLIQLAGVRYEQGRLAEIQKDITEHFERLGVPEWASSIAFVEAELGQLDGVQTRLEQAFTGYEEAGMRASAGVGLAAHMAGPVVATGDLELARRLYALVLPYSGIGSYFAYFAGPVDYALGLLARQLGAHEDAGRHFRHALAFSQRLGAPLWVKRCAAALS